jgi:hypothetical protein
VSDIGGHDDELVALIWAEVTVGASVVQLQVGEGGDAQLAEFVTNPVVGVVAGMGAALGKQRDRLAGDRDPRAG